MGLVGREVHHHDQDLHPLSAPLSKNELGRKRKKPLTEGAQRRQRVLGNPGLNIQGNPLHMCGNCLHYGTGHNRRTCQLRAVEKRRGAEDV